MNIKKIFSYKLDEFRYAKETNNLIDFIMSNKSKEGRRIFYEKYKRRGVQWFCMIHLCLISWRISQACLRTFCLINNSLTLCSSVRECGCPARGSMCIVDTASFTSGSRSLIAVFILCANSCS